MAAPQLTTYRDAIESLSRHVDASALEAESDRARSAVQDAYQELPFEHPWKYFTKHHRINVSTAYSTGTITYTASTRAAVISDGTWPSWARYGRLLIGTDTTLYKIAEISGTTATLETNFAPVADATSQTFNLYRSVYPLPGDFYRLEEVVDEAVWRTSYVEPSEWMQLERHVPRSGRPFHWTLLGSPDTFASMALAFYGYPATAQTFDFMYYRTARRLKYDGYKYYSSQGDDTITSYTKGETAVVLDGTSLETDVVNSVLRTGMSGATGPPGGIGAMERYAEQKIITARATTTTVTVGSAFEFAKVSDQFTISDPVDLPPYLLEAFKRGCEYQMAIQQASDRTARAEQNYRNALRRARGKNLGMPEAPGPLQWTGWKDPSWVFLTGTITQY